MAWIRRWASSPDAHRPMPADGPVGWLDGPVGWLERRFERRWVRYGCTDERGGLRWFSCVEPRCFSADGDWVLLGADQVPHVHSVHRRNMIDLHDDHQRLVSDDGWAEYGGSVAAFELAPPWRARGQVRGEGRVTRDEGRGEGGRE